MIELSASTLGRVQAMTRRLLVDGPIGALDPDVPNGAKFIDLMPYLTQTALAMRQYDEASAGRVEHAREHFIESLLALSAYLGMWTESLAAPQVASRKMRDVCAERAARRATPGYQFEAQQGNTL